MINYFDEDSFSSIIISEDVLLPDYLPDELLHRSSELKAIADAIKPILRRKAPTNLFIHGPSGSGKTSCMRYIMKQLAGHSNMVLPVYINCWETPTQMAIYNKIIEEMRLPLPRRGLATDEIFSRILEYARNYNKPILLVLDEMDGLRHENILYVTSRANKEKLIFGIMGISNNKELLSKLDSRIRSSLRFSEMEFKEYAIEQLFSILQTRAKSALKPGSYDQRLLKKISNSVEDGSARVAIGYLWAAAKKAEQKGREKIMIQDLEDTISEKTGSDFSEFNFTPDEVLIIEILKKGNVKSSDLYEMFQKEIPKTKRQIRNYLDLLEKKGVIESEEVEAEGILKPKVFRLKS